MITSLVSPNNLSTDKDMEVDVGSLSAARKEGQSGYSEIEVIACYRHHPNTQQKLTTGRSMTTDLPRCLIVILPEFPWTELEDLWSEEPQLNKLIRAGPKRAG